MREVVIGGAIIWLIWELRWVFLTIVIFDFVKWCLEGIGAGLTAVYHAIASMFRYFETQSRVWLLVAFALGGMITQVVQDWLKARSGNNRSQIHPQPSLDAPSGVVPAPRRFPPSPPYQP